MKITINEKEYDIRFSFRSLIIWEKISERTFALLNTTDLVTYFYSILLAQDETLQWDDFLDYLDQNPQAFADFCKWVSDTNEINKALKGKSKKK